MSLIYEGKAKRLFTTEDPNELLMEFKDDATAFNGAKKKASPRKARSINASPSTFTNSWNAIAWPPTSSAMTRRTP